MQSAAPCTALKELHRIQDKSMIENTPASPCIIKNVGHGGCSSTRWRHTCMASDCESSPFIPFCKMLGQISKFVEKQHPVTQRGRVKQFCCRKLISKAAEHPETVTTFQKCTADTAGGLRTQFDPDKEVEKAFRNVVVQTRNQPYLS